ncbi:MAG: hypothetical protein RL281_1183 [Pseudomonadota bacterium]
MPRAHACRPRNFLIGGCRASLRHGRKFEPLEGQTPEWWGIASLQLSATEHALQLGHAGGPSLMLKSLPYPLLEDL